MSRYEAVQRQEQINQMVKLIEKDPRYKWNIMAHKAVLREALRLQKEMFFSYHIGPKERLKNEYRIKTQFIRRILELDKPPAQAQTGQPGVWSERGKERTVKGKDS